MNQTSQLATQPLVPSQRGGYAENNGLNDIYTSLSRNPCSGQFDKDFYRTTQMHFKEKDKTLFDYDSPWRILRTNPQWCTHEDKKRHRAKVEEMKGEELELKKREMKIQRKEKDFQFYIQPHEHLSGTSLSAFLQMKEEIMKRWGWK
ncbi:hypothetical protein QVD17_34611 [Tagetes erecta]|uniref:Uncharacterized protein n=1 Tax=Tagetes erecta TaxID=13708 RepID=A0AAD8NKI4_TARER|nr:hypothetical protein QVD17_34611 [Tagetes erecta]